VLLGLRCGSGVEENLAVFGDEPERQPVYQTQQATLEVLFGPLVTNGLPKLWVAGVVEESGLDVGRSGAR
jgi:hypothetical protein